MISDQIRGILAAAYEHHIELWFEANRLRYRAPSGALPTDLRASLSIHREEILAALHEEAATQVTKSVLSYGQQALWFLQQTEPSSAAYNVAFTGRISSSVDTIALCSAFQALSDRHPMLRATIQTQDGTPWLNIAGYVPIDINQIDASQWDDDECYEHVRQDYLTPFDLQNGPILRVYLYSRSPLEHILLINVHHIALDGWSMWILLDELRQLYTAATGGTPVNLPRPSTVYTDFISWQHATMNSPAGETHWQYWKDKLQGNLPVLNLPTDYPRPDIQTARGASVNFIIPAEITRALRELARTESVTLYTLMAAAFQVLLQRYSGQDDLITGLPTFGRDKAEYARVIGDFINMIPLRVDASGDPTFKEFLERVRAQILAGMEHQDLPFPELVARLGGHRDAGRSPLFQITFDMQRLQGFGELTDLFIPGKGDALVDFGGLKLQQYIMPQQEGQFDLGLLMMDTETVLPGSLKYHTDLYTERTARQIVAHYQQLLQEIANNPNRPISAFPLLTAAEREQILFKWNNTLHDYPQNVCLPQLFEAQVERTPEAVAVKFEDTSLTYKALNSRANQLAHHLRSLGVSPDQLIGIYLQRSLEMVVAVLGVLKSGGAYVPMDPIYPPQRIQAMIEDSQMPVLITQQSLVDDLPQHNASLVIMDDDSGRIPVQSQENLPPAAKPENLAYVIFTSGSTGRPKGVQIPHRALVNFLYAMQEQPGIRSDDILTSITTLSFDIAGLELYLPLLNGACLVILSADTTTDGMALAEALDQSAATILQATPATWRLLIETGWPGRPGLKMLCGGEPLPAALASQLLQKGGMLWNMYGPTETTIWSTIQQISSNDPVITIGRPVANTQIYILDSYLQPVPIGVSGQLFIAGDGLARGYLNRPDLTAERFISNPFISGQRMYQTGDLGRYLPDGRIEHLGRADSQVKLRGFRIELGEIESVLNEHPALEQAVVTLREDTPGDRRLVAYYRTDAAPTTRELSKHLRTRLPAYMVPSAYVLVETFPLTPNGKIDRRALPAPERGPAESAQAAQPPTTPTEQLIAETWKHALQVEQVNLFDNFFDLGGHSLLAMRVVTAIQEKTDIRIEPAYLRFESLGQLAARLEERLHAL